MKIGRFLTALAVGLSLLTTTPISAIAEVLRVMEGSSTEPLNVPMNRAVVVESELPFAELSIFSRRAASACSSGVTSGSMCVAMDAM